MQNHDLSTVPIGYKRKLDLAFSSGAVAYELPRPAHTSHSWGWFDDIEDSLQTFDASKNLF